MPDKCCVPRCNGNYKTGPKVHVFGLPKDEALRSAWINAIPRENLIVSQRTKVCERHFSDDDVLREVSHVDEVTGRTVTAPLSRVRLRPGAVPSKFPGCPDYLSKHHARREDPDSKRLRQEASAMERALAESIDSFRNEEEADRILSIKDLSDHLKNVKSAFWHVIEGNGHLTLVHIVETEAPWIKYSIVVKPDLTLTLHFAKTQVTRLGSNLLIPRIANSKRGVVELLESVENWDNDLESSSESSHNDICATIRFLLDKLPATQSEDQAAVIQLLAEQLKLISSKKERRRYSVDFMVFACILFTISPHAYQYIRSSGSIVLPHPRTIRSICSSFGMSPQNEQQSSSFLSYMAKRISDLNDDQRYVTLMVDEVHIKPFFDYKGGSIVGVALNSTEVANSAFVFMVQSIKCQFKEVAHVVPVHGANAEFLHKLLRDVICGLEKIGYRVMCVVTDNNAVNRKAMALFKSSMDSHDTPGTTTRNQDTPDTTMRRSNEFCYPHPSDPNRPLFFVIDTVHIIKCIRNNWLKQDDQCFWFPELHADTEGQRRMLCASFKTIKAAYDLECDQLLRYGYKVSRKSLCPSSIEKQNVKLALQIFDSSLPSALRAIGEKHNLKFFKETATFIEIIVTWWKIVNVKTPGKGSRLKDRFQEPVRPAPDDEKVDFLYDILDWLDEWQKNANNCKLTDKTHTALHQSTYALLEICRYCFEELNLSYVLLGKFQTDCLEDRFGRYRRLAGSQYHISIRQLYEGENKLRLQNTLAPIGKASETERDEKWEEMQKRRDAPRPSYNIVVTEDSLSKIKDIVPVLAYVAGYAVYATVKKLKCENCKNALTTDHTITAATGHEHYHLIKEIDRGGLLYPAMTAVNAVAHNYVVVEEMSKRVDFLTMSNQRQLVTELTLDLLVDEDCDFDVCEEGHTSEVVLKHLLWCSTNILLKNFCRKLNDKVVETNNKSKKRKLTTLTKK